MEYDNEMILEMTAKSKNESFARVVAASFAASLDPTIAEITDIKTAVSEAVTNAIIHGYGENPQKGIVKLKCGIVKDTVYIEVIDFGSGISNIKEAMTPLYTSVPGDERSGMGFTIMETFMDSVEVSSEPNEGTIVRMHKKIGQANI